MAKMHEILKRERREQEAMNAISIILDGENDVHYITIANHSQLWGSKEEFQDFCKTSL